MIAPDFDILDVEMANAAINRLELEMNLRTALVEDQFRIHFQPQFEVATGNLTGAEALLRWEHPELGIVYPGGFLGVAESAGLLPEIGRFVLSESLRISSSWSEFEASNLRIAINMSSEELATRETIDNILDELRRHSFPASLLEIEVSERTAMKDDQLLAEHFRLLQFAEVRLAVDDFRHWLLETFSTEES